MGSVCCNLATKLKFLLGIDDGLDVAAFHLVGGFAGNMLTGLFAAPYVAHMDGVTVIPGGWIAGNWIQLGYQLAGSLAYLLHNAPILIYSITFYAFTVSFIILIIMDRIPGMKLRVDERSEMMGLDVSQMGEVSFEILSEKEQWSFSDIFGDAHLTDLGGIQSGA